MPAAYSMDLRQRIINAYEAKEGSPRNLAKRFQVSLSFVKRLVIRYRETGLVKPKPHGGGARVVFLPPYSPETAPIELCWSKLKQCLRTAKARTTTAINQALTEIINQQISSDDAMGWFNHCGLFI